MSNRSRYDSVGARLLPYVARREGGGVEGGPLRRRQLHSASFSLGMNLPSTEPDGIDRAYALVEPRRLGIGLDQEHYSPGSDRCVPRPIEKSSAGTRAEFRRFYEQFLELSDVADQRDLDHTDNAPIHLCDWEKRRPHGFRCERELVAADCHELLVIAPHSFRSETKLGQDAYLVELRSPEHDHE